MVSMATVSISETKAKLSELLHRVKAGETITITDRGVPVAQLAPLNAGEVDWDTRLASLERRGLITRPKNEKPDLRWLLERPLPKSRESVLEALLEERRQSPY
jgi:prevent-host-death family protein